MSILAPVNVRLQAVGRDAIDVSLCPHHCFFNVAAVGGRTCVVASSRSQLDICFAKASCTRHFPSLGTPRDSASASLLGMAVSKTLPSASWLTWHTTASGMSSTVWCHGSSACAHACSSPSGRMHDDVNCHLDLQARHCTAQRATAYTCTTFEVVPAASSHTPMHVIVNELTDDHRGHNRGCLFVCSCLSR
jgi:hypothetical protein